MATPEDCWSSAYADGVRRRGLDYPSGSLIDEFDEAVRTYGDKPALDFFARRTSYAQLGEQVEQVASSLHALGVGPGSTVALLMPTCPQHVVAFYAVLACGGTVVEHNPLYPTQELAPLFADHRADVAIVWNAAAQTIHDLPAEHRPHTIIAIDLLEEMTWAKRLLLRLPIAKARQSRAQLSQPAPEGTLDFADMLRGAAESVPAANRPANEDVALLLYTSGTTGRPKGVPLTHRNLLATTTQAIEWVTPLQPGKEVFMACLPLFHVFGCSLSMNAGLTVGAMLHLIPKPETGLILDAIRRRTPTMMIAVPPLFDRVVQGAHERGQSLQGIRTGIAGAMSLRPELIDAWESATGGLLIEGYGMTECSPILAGNPVDETREAGAIGLPFPDTDLRLVDPDDPSREVEPGQPGEILAKGPQVFGGYRDRPEETAAAFHDGWFRTGDIAVMADNGFLRIVDRLKEMVITGGFNVYPSEVEDAIREEGFFESAVVGWVDENGSEEVIAAIVTPDGALPDVEALRQRLKERIAAYKVPRRFHVLAELPRNEMGKVLRREVRTRLEEFEKRRREG